MTTPFRPVKPGGQLSARQVNQLQRLGERSAKITASPPLEVIRSPDGYHLRLPTPPSIFVKITGKDSSPGGAAPSADFHYSGVQQLDSTDDPATEDLTTALNFYADVFPLVEINGITDLPLDGSLVVRAWIGMGGDYYTFDGGTTLGDAGFWAELTASPKPSNDCPLGYAWTRVNEDDANCSGWTDTAPPLSGDATDGGMPAVEADDRTDVPLTTNGEPTRVFLRLAATGDRYTFAYPGPDRCDCNSGTWTGFSVTSSCTVEFVAYRCDPVTGTPTRITTRICSTVPFTVGTKEESAASESTELEVVLHPITFARTGCTVTPHYSTKIIAPPDTLIVGGNTY